ncbi:MAG TPA: class I SAM-dependent methyltransferase [Actinophytocola sp.]|jgi:predicted TPR repeat methyltransferase|nr:class I SAM-dependent methyltransferase [Actinophytocola sp.]
MTFDSTGKESFDHVYTASDPRPYFHTLREVEYQMPQHAKPYFAKLIDERGASTVLDVGCSYGVNAALYRCEATMDELYEHYAREAETGVDRAALVELDRAQVRNNTVQFIGLDVSEPALRYAKDAGFLDDFVYADLESTEPTPEQSAILARADLVVSTGCIGYVTERTITQLADLPGGRRPAMAHFVLRMFSYEPVADALAALGYETAGVTGLFKQRRFSAPQEQEQILDAMRARGVTPHELETDGWLCAELYLSSPTEP